MKFKEKTSAETVGDILKQIRDDIKMTQAEMGKRLGFSGPTVITHIETGVREVRLWEFIEFCRITEHTPEEVLTVVMQKAPGSHIWPTEDTQETGKKTQNKRRSRKA